MTSMTAPLAAGDARVCAQDAGFRPALYLWLGRLVARITRIWFRYRIDGLERIPRRPVLLVGNHSGIGIADVLCLFGAWREAFGLVRRPVGMMHEMFVDAPIIGFFARAIGAVRADPRAAREAFACGRDVVAFPGGAIDSCRPITARNEVRFGAHRGYAKLALELGVPIVPFATVGSHETYIILPGFYRITRALGLHSRGTIVPITLGAVGLIVTLALALAGVVPPLLVLAALVVALVPSPFRVTTHVLPPIDVVTATAHLPDERARIELAHELVLGALQRAVLARKS